MYFFSLAKAAVTAMLKTASFLPILSQVFLISSSVLCVCPADTLARVEGTAPVKDSGIIGMPFGAPSHHYIVESISEFALERGEPRWGTRKE